MVIPKRIQFCACAAAVLILASCSNIVNRGHLKEDEEVAKIKAGITSRADVVKNLGTPSSESSFGPKTWYYITVIRETRSILPPKILDQHVVEIVFDSRDVVTSVKTYSMSDAKNIQIAQRVTPSEGQHLGFFEQIFANLGRFNKNDDNSTSNDHGHAPNPTGYPGR